MSMNIHQREELKRGVTLLLVLLLAVGAIFGTDYIFRNGLNIASLIPSKENTLQKYADQVMAACKKDTYPPRCYDTEIPKLMDQGVSLEDSFKVTVLIQKATNGYFFCHVLGHNLAAKETAKDPSKWTDVIGRCPTGMCSNGCLHGAAQERFRAEALTPEQIDEVLPQLAGICQQGHERNFTGLEQASCYHALGHLSMYITNADIRASTRICNTIARPNNQDYTQTCYEGAYMQIYQPLEPEDFALVKDIAPQTQAASEAFCSTFSGEYREACHRESWPLYRESLQTPDGLQKFCNATYSPESKRRCYNAMFYTLVAQMNFEVERITPLCEGLPTGRKAQCFANAASRCIETDYRLAPKALELCSTAEKNGVGDRCYNELLFYSSFNYHVGSKEFVQFCNQLPGDWKNKCLTTDTKTLHPVGFDE